MAIFFFSFGVDDVADRLFFVAAAVAAAVALQHGGRGLLLFLGLLYHDYHFLQPSIDGTQLGVNVQFDVGIVEIVLVK